MPLSARKRQGHQQFFHLYNAISMVTLGIPLLSASLFVPSYSAKSKSVYAKPLNEDNFMPL